ncbi:MAG: TROVE domain-containing protein [Catenulispora sp.]|nr:TROVE domain-containing protein [Catenulispora sp.]
MARFNRQRFKAATRSEISVDANDLVAARRIPPHCAAPNRPTWEWEKMTRVMRRGNFSGGPAHKRDPKSELFLLAAANMVGKGTFYEAADTRSVRYRALVRELALGDPEWTVGMLRWIRTEAQMRTVAMVGAAEFVRTRVDAGAHGHSRQAVDAVLQRPDEPGKLLEYWTSRYGRALPMPLKRGVADAVRRLYTGRALLKYDTDSAVYRFGDVLELTHPTPAADRPWQADIFRYALDRRHHGSRAVPPAGEAMLTAHRELMALPVAERRAAVTGPGGAERLAAAGMTWEALAGWLRGPLDAAAWEAVIPSMGSMALVRNLRNFEEAGISDAAAELVVARLSDREEVLRSRQFPFRFLSAYRHASPERWGHALETALGHSLGNVPALPGRTLVLVDRSGSMFWESEPGTDLTRADSAAIFGTALAVRGESVDLVEFGTVSNRIEVGPQASVLQTLSRFTECGGTFTAWAVRTHYRGHDRVVLITDEQAYRTEDSILAPVPEHVPVYTWNLAGYAYAHAAASRRHYTFGGLSDAAFRMIPWIEEGLGTVWPWERNP